MITKAEARQIAANYESEMKDLQRRIDSDTAKLKSEKEQTLMAKVSEGLADFNHRVAAAEYIRFKQSEAYVLKLQADIKAANQTATHPMTGSIAAIRMNSDSSKLDTFDNLSPGQVYTISDRPYLCKSFTHDYSGSTADVLYLGTKVYIDGEKVLPYGGIDAALSGNVLTVANRDSLKPGQKIVISGQKFLPTHTIGYDKNFVRYELEVA